MLEVLADEYKGLVRSRHAAIWPLKSMMAAIILPFLAFILIYKLTSGGIRYKHPQASVISAAIIGVSGCFIAMYIAYSRWRYFLRARAHIVVAILLWFVVIIGGLCGDACYWENDRPYYTYEGSAAYFNIDPYVDKGKAYMDAGKVYFKEGSYVEIDKATGVRMSGIYCVAPIVRQPIENQGSVQEVGLSGPLETPKAGTFDWWAVGKDCCDPMFGANYKCTDSRNPYARSGLRMVDDESREYFLMAIQEWTSQYNLPAVHPQLFWWVQDPLISEDSFKLKSQHHFNTCMVRCLVLCIVASYLLHYFVWTSFGIM